MPTQRERLNELEPLQSDTSDLRVVGSQEILKGERAVLISHNGEAYRLYVSKNGKLLLNKDN
jgi:hemin uptake protein HemP